MCLRPACPYANRTLTWLPPALQLGRRRCNHQVCLVRQWPAPLTVDPGTDVQLNHVDYDRLLSGRLVVCPAEAGRRIAVDAHVEPTPLARHLDVGYGYRVLDEPAGVHCHPVCAVHAYPFDVGLQRQGDVLEPVGVGELFHIRWV